MIPMDLEVVISYLIHFRYPQVGDYDKDGHMYYVNKISITSKSIIISITRFYLLDCGSLDNELGGGVVDMGGNEERDNLGE